MGSDVFQKNLGELIRRGALRPDEPKARGRFLREVATPAERLSWKFAAAAAALLVAATIVSSAGTRVAVQPRPAPSVRPPSPESPSGHPLGGDFRDELLGGDFILRDQVRPPKAEFHGYSKRLPEGLFFRLHVHRESEKFDGDRLVAYEREFGADTIALQRGEVRFDWPYTGPAMVRVGVSAPDGLQELEMARALNVPESRRNWSFATGVWNQDVLWRLESQLPEAVAIAGKLRSLIGRIEATCTSEALFKGHEKEFIADAERIQSLATSFGGGSLFPASMGEVECVARDLAVLMPIFRWEEGKFAGPKSYYTNGRPATTFHSDPFGFDALRQYVDRAIVIAGREFLLWIVRDVRRASLGEDHRRLVRSNALMPGVADFAQRFLQVDADGLAGLEPEIRAVKK